MKREKGNKDSRTFGFRLYKDTEAWLDGIARALGLQTGPTVGVILDMLRSRGKENFKKMLMEHVGDSVDAVSEEE